MRYFCRKKIELVVTLICTSYLWLVFYSVINTKIDGNHEKELSLLFSTAPHSKESVEIYEEISFDHKHVSNNVITFNRQIAKPFRDLPYQVIKAPPVDIPRSKIHTAKTRQEVARKWAYTPPYSGALQGKQFNVSTSLLHKLQFPIRDFVTLNYENVRKFVFVTAASSDFYTPLLALISSIQTNFPDRDIFVFDLGLNKNQSEELGMLCNVIIRDFHALFKGFPRHIFDLNSYAWKALAIHDILSTSPGVFWVDTSVRFDRYNLTAVYEHLVMNSQGIGLFSKTGHSIYAATSKQMYHYLPTQTSRTESVEQLEANSMLLFKTRPVSSQVLQWLFLCSLDKNCIQPENVRRFCDFKNSDRFHTFANCHRFDQSALNILLANMFQFQSSEYFLNDDILHIERGNTPDEITLTSCS